MFLDHNVAVVDASHVIERFACTMESHIPDSPGHLEMKRALDELFSEAADRVVALGGGIRLFWPYRSMGNIDSNNLLDPEEFACMAFYIRARDRYSRVFDVGANIGLHTVLFAKLGWQVTAFEPDPGHVEQLATTIRANQLHGVEVHQVALGAERSRGTFVRVEGNTTSSHLKGLKDPYGQLTEFEVEVHPIADFGPAPDLLKMDAEGGELYIFPAIPGDWWKSMDALVEVHGADAAAVIARYAYEHGLRIFVQSLGWRRLESVEQMPTHHSHGSIFVTRRERMPWA